MRRKGHGRVVPTCPLFETGDRRVKLAGPCSIRTARGRCAGRAVLGELYAELGSDDARLRVGASGSRQPPSVCILNGAGVTARPTDRGTELLTRGDSDRSLRSRHICSSLPVRLDSKGPRGNGAGAAAMRRGSHSKLRPRDGVGIRTAAALGPDRPGLHRVRALSSCARASGTRPDGCLAGVPLAVSTKLVWTQPLGLAGRRPGRGGPAYPPPGPLSTPSTGESDAGKRTSDLFEPTISGRPEGARIRASAVT